MISVFLTFEQSLVSVRMSRDRRTDTRDCRSIKRQKKYAPSMAAEFARTGSRIFCVCLQNYRTKDIVFIMGMMGTTSQKGCPKTMNTWLHSIGILYLPIVLVLFFCCEDIQVTVSAI